MLVVPLPRYTYIHVCTHVSRIHVNKEEGREKKRKKKRKDPLSPDPCSEKLYHSKIPDLRPCQLNTPAPTRGLLRSRQTPRKSTRGLDYSPIGWWRALLFTFSIKHPPTRGQTESAGGPRGKRGKRGYMYDLSCCAVLRCAVLCCAVQQRGTLSPLLIMAHHSSGPPHAICPAQTSIYSPWRKTQHNLRLRLPLPFPLYARPTLPHSAPLDLKLLEWDGWHYATGGGEGRGGVACLYRTKEPTAVAILVRFVQQGSGRLLWPICTL